MFSGLKILAGLSDFLSSSPLTLPSCSDKNICLYAAAAKSLQLCPTLCDHIDSSPPGSSIPGIDSPGKNSGVGCHFLLQCMKVKSLIRIQLLATSWTAAYQVPLPMGFSRQEYWSGVPFPSPICLYKAPQMPKQ